MVCKQIFITATDTEAGKTWVTASAIRALLREGKSAKALKPIACGLDEHGNNEDIDALLSAQNLSDPDEISFCRYALPAAPSQAAAAEDETVDIEKLVRWCKAQSEKVDTCLIEGVGGLMVPVTNHWLVSDWIEALPDAEIWLVVGCKLGAINQTLLTLEKLKQMGRSPSRIFYNATTPECNDWIDPVMEAVQQRLGQACAVQSLMYREEIKILS